MNRALTTRIISVIPLSGGKYHINTIDGGYTAHPHVKIPASFKGAVTLDLDSRQRVVHITAHTPGTPDAAEPATPTITVRFNEGAEEVHVEAANMEGSRLEDALAALAAAALTSIRKAPGMNYEDAMDLVLEHNATLVDSLMSYYSHPSMRRRATPYSDEA